MLNLKGEYVYNSEKSKKTLLHLSSDIEGNQYLLITPPLTSKGHKGKDNRFYLVDTARLCPPSAPKSGVKGSFLINHLRPGTIYTIVIFVVSD